MTNDGPAANLLDRLEQYLLQDPNNLHLLADAFDAAFRAGEWERGRFHLRHALALGAGGYDWAQREVHLAIATRRWDDASMRLEQLRDSPDLPADALPAVLHDLAYSAFRQGDLAKAKAILSPWIEGEGGTRAPTAVQALWLRTLHHSGDLDGAVAWARAQQQNGALDAGAAGVASLAALDLGELEPAAAWAAMALQANPNLLEALVTQASLALAHRDTAGARGALAHALQVHPEDGRAWSALGFADLQEQQLQAAEYDFHQAVRFMPGHVGTWNGLGWTSILRREFGAAASAFEQALALDRNFAESHGGLAVAYAFLGKREQAEEAIARAQGLDKTSLAAQYAGAILNGEASDAQAIQRLAARLLQRRAAPLGGTLSEWLPQPAEPTDI